MRDEWDQPKKWAMEHLALAVNYGLIRPAASCEQCGQPADPPAGYHWRGYGNPYDVVWLCTPCFDKADTLTFVKGQPTTALGRARIETARVEARLLRKQRASGDPNWTLTDEAVQLITDLWARGRTWSHIARALTYHKIPTPPGNAAMWSPAGVRWALDRLGLSESSRSR